MPLSTSNTLPITISPPSGKHSTIIRYMSVNAAAATAAAAAAAAVTATTAAVAVTTAAITVVTTAAGAIAV